MIYIDTSVVLAQLLAEDRRPAPTFWNESLISSRLLEYETRLRLNAYRVSPDLREAAGTLIARISLVELSPLVLDRALEPLPSSCRTFDALHLATALFLRERRLEVRLATYDRRMMRVAQEVNLVAFEP